MQEMGFTAYEAKTYVTLLQHNPATGYEISAKSEVPRSAIYDVLKRLESTGIVNAVHAKPRRYIPLPPEQLLTMLQEKFRNNIDSLRAGLDEFDTEPEYSDLWHIQGYDNMLRKAGELIQSAEREVYLSVWATEQQRLKEALSDAGRRELELVTFSFTTVPVQVGTIFSYGLAEEELEKIWSRKIVLIVDKEEVLMGEASRQGAKSVVWTHNPAIVTIALNHIVLDITLFAQRYEISVDETLNRMMNGGGKELDQLLAEKDASGETPVVNNGS